jgi:hypothetical protein
MRGRKSHIFFLHFRAGGDTQSPCRLWERATRGEVRAGWHGGMPAVQGAEEDRLPDLRRGRTDEDRDRTAFRAWL